MDFFAGQLLVDVGAEGFGNYVESGQLWQPAPPNWSDGGDPANSLWDFLSRDETGCSQAIADTVIQSPKSWTERVKDALQIIRFKDLCVLVQFWCPDQQAGNGRGCVLRTLNQPFQLTELSDDLCSYRVASLKYEFYVDRENDVGVGLIGRAFLNGLPEWAPNVQTYSRKEFPQIDDAVCCNIRGSLAMPVFEDNGLLCLGVLEIVMTVMKESFDYEFREICIALQGVNLKSSELLVCPTKNLTRQSKPIVDSDVAVRPKRKPKTKTSGITREDLIRLFDKPRATAAEELNICKSSFRNICRQMGIKKWPYKKRTRCGGKHKKVTLEQTKCVLEPTSFAALDDIVMEEPSNLTSEGESGGVILDDFPPKLVFESTFLADPDATTVEDLGDVITMAEYGTEDLGDVITMAEYGTEVMGDQSDQQFLEGWGNSFELSDLDYAWLSTVN